LSENKETRNQGFGTIIIQEIYKNSEFGLLCIILDDDYITQNFLLQNQFRKVESIYDEVFYLKNK
jgi:hypothetical protein